MSEVQASVEVRVPVRTAYNQWTQFESFPQFMAGVLAVRQVDDRRTHWVTEVAGARREFEAEIVEQLPDERIAWRSTDGDLRHHGAVTFEPVADGRTRVSVDLAWEPDGLREKAGGVFRIDRLQVKADLERFRRFVEDHGAETGRWRGEISGVEPRLAGTEAMPAGAQTADRHGRPRHDVVDILLAQHEQLKDLLDRIPAVEGEPKQRLFAELVSVLDAHEKGEQRVVHPMMRTSVEGGAATANSLVSEEQQADELLAEIRTMDANALEFDALFRRLRRAVLRHAEQEEQEEFPKLRRELPPARLRTMAEELVAVQNARN